MTRAIVPPFGVVIPAFGHPKFLAEAIISACEQKADREIRVVVVDDGCRFEETGSTVAQLLPKYSDSLFYLRQKNTRLPGARNAGIQFLLNLEPDIEAIYLLDADNRLSSSSLMVFWRALGREPNVGWAYPDISFFGLTRGEDGFDTRETAPVYSPLKHLVGNISEAGSMVRADMFRAGVMFDETMTSGFEDWEFWLSALEAGYRGVRAIDTGFLYRGRPESMLADSRRLAAVLVDKIRTKHKSLFDPKHIMYLEHNEAPTFAIFVPEDAAYYLCSDPLAAHKTVTLENFTASFHAWAYNSVEHFFPTHILVVPKAIWEGLQEQKQYLRWFFWKLREVTAQKLLIKVENSGRLMFQMMQDSILHTSASIYCFSTNILLREKNHISDLQDGILCAHLSLPFSANVQKELTPEASTVTDQHVTQLIEPFFPYPQYAQHTSRTFAGPHSRTVREIMIRDICAFENREPFPACTQIRRTVVAIKMALLSRADASHKLKTLLEHLKKYGDETFVLLENDGDMEHVFLLSGIDAWPDVADTIIPFFLPGNELEYSIYLGKRYQRELTEQAANDLAIIVRTADQIITCGATATIEALGEARQHGATGHVWLAPEFMVDEATTGLGLAKLLAFEHAATCVATDDLSYRDLLAAEGFPSAKFMNENTFFETL